MVVVGPNDFHLTYALRFNFKTSNKKAEYEILITGLKIAKRADKLDNI